MKQVNMRWHRGIQQASENWDQLNVHRQDYVAIRNMSLLYFPNESPERVLRRNSGKMPITCCVQLEIRKVNRKHKICKSGFCSTDFIQIIWPGIGWERQIYNPKVKRNGKQDDVPYRSTQEKDAQSQRYSHWSLHARDKKLLGRRGNRHMLLWVIADGYRGW